VPEPVNEANKKAAPPAVPKFKGRTLAEELGGDAPIVDRRAILIGLGVSLGVLLGAILWRITPSAAVMSRAIEEFVFEVVEPKVEDYRIEEPIRDIMTERREEMGGEVEKAERIETPDIQVSAAPQAVPVEQAVIQSKNVDIATPKIDVAATELDVQDAPLEISQTAEETAYALNPIAADALDPADFVKYDEPAPRDRPARYTMNVAPQPGRKAIVVPRKFGDQTAPTLGKLGPANVNLFGAGDFFATLERAGGVKTKAAVDSALHWLAAHQEADGVWRADLHEGPEDASAAVSALACLALMSGGHTTRKGEYRRNVLKGLEAVMRCQQADGRIAWKGSSLYTHAIAAIALCESYGRARDERIGAAARKAVAFCERAVNADCGWRYQPQSSQSDVSVTAWFIQALKTARLAQIPFDNGVFSQAMTFLDSVTDMGAVKDSNGAVGYTYDPAQRFGGNPHHALTCAGMMIRQFSGMGVKNHLLVKGAELTKDRPPRWDQRDFYYWYYATYAMHNMGGEYRIWWNQRIRDVLLEHQCRDGDRAGSWDPKGDRWADRAGRVYTTALGALCLEVYYRYSEALTSFGVAPDIDELFAQ
jgi:hypothetical protein